MKRAFTATVFLLLTLASFANPAKRNRELEARRDKRLAAEAAAAAAQVYAAQTASSSKGEHNPPSEQFGKVAMPEQTSRQRSITLKGSAVALKKRPMSLDRAEDSAAPKRVKVKLGGKPVREEDTMSFSDHSSWLGSHSSSSDSPLETVGLPRSSLTQPSPGTSTSGSSMYSPTFSFSASSKAPLAKKPQQTKAARLAKTEKPTTMSLPKSRFVSDFNSPLAKQGKEYFDRVWREENLGLDMSPYALADRIKMMSAAGLESHTGKMLMRQKLQNSPSQEYYDAFSHRSKQWNVAVGNAKRMFRLQDTLFSRLSEKERRKRVYLRASESIQRNQQEEIRAKKAMGYVSRRSSHGRRKVAFDQRQALVEDVGDAFRKHLTHKDMNFDSMTPEDIEIESRGLSHPDVKSLTYPKLLVEYIGKHRSSDEVMRFRKKRVKSNTMAQRQRLKEDNA